MLAKPFKLIHKIDINRYYHVMFDPYNQFVVTESIFYLRHNPNAKPKEKTQALKMLRLSAPVLSLVIGYAGLPPIEKDKGAGPENFYPKMDLSPVKEWINTLIESQKDLKDGQFQGITTPDTYENETIKALVEKEGFEILGVLDEGSRTDTVLLVKQNALGVLKIIEAVVSGKEEKSVVSVQTHVFNVDICKKLVDSFAHPSTKKSNKELEKELEEEQSKIVEAMRKQIEKKEKENDQND